MVAINRLKDPPKWLEVATTLKNTSTPTHIYWHTEAKSRQMPFCMQHFQMYFLEWILFYFGSNFTEVGFYEHTWKQVHIDSGNDLALSRQEVITSIDDSVQ